MVHPTRVYSGSVRWKGQKEFALPRVGYSSTQVTLPLPLAPQHFIRCPDKLLVPKYSPGQRDTHHHQVEFALLSMTGFIQACLSLIASGSSSILHSVSSIRSLIYVLFGPPGACLLWVGFQSNTLSKGKSLSWEHIMQCGSKVSKMDFSTLSPVQWSHYAYLVIPNKKLICNITLNSRRLLRGILNWPADQSECFIYIKKYP